MSRPPPSRIRLLGAFAGSAAAGALAVTILLLAPRAAAPTEAPPDVPATADEVLGWIALAYGHSPEVEMPFETTRSVRGRLVIRRPGRFRIQYDEPEASICNDGVRSRYVTTSGEHLTSAPLLGFAGFDLLVGPPDDRRYELEDGRSPTTVCLRAEGHPGLRLCVLAAGARRGEVILLSSRSDDGAETTFRFGPVRGHALADPFAPFCPEPSGASRALGVPVTPR